MLKILTVCRSSLSAALLCFYRGQWSMSELYSFLHFCPRYNRNSSFKGLFPSDRHKPSGVGYYSFEFEPSSTCSTMDSWELRFIVLLLSTSSNSVSGHSNFLPLYEASCTSRLDKFRVRPCLFVSDGFRILVIHDDIIDRFLLQSVFETTILHKEEEGIETRWGILK